MSETATATLGSTTILAPAPTQTTATSPTVAPWRNGAVPTNAVHSLEGTGAGQPQGEGAATPTPSIALEATEAATQTVTILVEKPAAVLPEPQPGPSGWIWVLLGVLVLASVATVLLILQKMKKKNRSPQTLYTEQDTPAEEDDLPASGWLISAAQSIGTRHTQEDALCYSSYVEERGMLAAVADGIGGMSDGQVASTTAVRKLLGDFRGLPGSPSGEELLLRLLSGAQQAVLEANRHRSLRCGCTLISVLLCEDSLFFLSVGDSRVSLCREGGLLQLNREHVLASQLDESGTPPQAGQRRKALTAYIGKEDLQLMDRNTIPIPVYGGDQLLLMTDGVFGTLTEAQILQALRGDPHRAANRIIRMVDAQKRKGQDNATVVVLTRTGGRV